MGIRWVQHIRPHARSAARKLSAWIFGTGTERKQRDVGFERHLLKLKRRLDEQVGLLVGRVDRLFLELGFDPHTLEFDNQKIETKQQSHRLTPSSSPAGEPNVLYNLANPIEEEA